MHASRNNGPEVLSTLLQVDPELEIRNNSGLTALMLAAGFNENPEMITLLTEAGAQVDAQSEPDGWSALMMSSLGNNPNVIRTLLDVGADISVKSLTGRVAYDYVLENPNIITTDVLSRLSTNSSANDGKWLWGAIKGILALFLTVSFGYIIIGSIFSQGILAFSYGIPMSRHLRSLDIIDNETVLVRGYLLTIVLSFSVLIILYVLTGYFLGSSFIIMMTIGLLSSLSVYSLEDPEHMWSFVSLNSSSFKNPQLPDILVSKYFGDLLWMNRSKRRPSFDTVEELNNLLKANQEDGYSIALEERTRIPPLPRLSNRAECYGITMLIALGTALYITISAGRFWSLGSVFFILISFIFISKYLGQVYWVVLDLALGTSNNWGLSGTIERCIFLVMVLLQVSLTIWVIKEAYRVFLVIFS